MRLTIYLILFIPFISLSQNDSLNIILKFVDSKTNQPISDSHLEISTYNNKIIFDGTTSSNFKIKVNRYNKLILSVERDNYLFTSDSILLENQKEDSLVKIVRMDELLLEPFHKIPDIYFKRLETNLLKDTARLQSLNKLIKFLEIFSDLKLSIEGHCDNSEIKNKTNISYLRASSVQDYLISKGIDKKRITVVYYGAQRPVCPNTTDEWRALNRRVEIVIIKNK